MPVHFNIPMVAVADAATVKFNFAEAKDQKVTLGGNRTLVFENADPGDFIAIHLIQDATGSRTVTWPATAKFSGGTAPTLTITASKRDTFNFYYDGTNFYLVSQVLNF